MNLCSFTDENKAKIDEARELLETLTDNQGELLPSNVVKDLEDKEAVYEALGKGSEV